MPSYYQFIKGTLKGTAKAELDLTLYKCVD